MGKIKSVENTVLRIIGKVESGDYDEDILVHMVQSLVDNRDNRIKVLEKRERPQKFVISEKKIIGALRSCIKEHGDITKDNIGSATKRIYGTCLEIENPPTPVFINEEPTVTIVHDKNIVHKLTVAHDGNIRIKIARQADESEVIFISTVFVNVAREALALNKGTLRGSVKNNDMRRVITLYNDSKTEHYTFSY